MTTFRPMTEGDVPAAVAAFEQGLLTMQARHNLPVTGNSIRDEKRRQDRTRHFLGTDPAGSWVAEDGGAIIGMSQSFVREGYWMLSQLGTLPGRQGAGVGKELLRLALAHGDPEGPGTIQCSRDPKAMALYSSVGFTLHPVVAAWGPMRPNSAAARPPEVERYEPDQVGERELAVVDAIDRSVRGAARAVDIVAMLEQPGSRLLLRGADGYAVAMNERIVTLGARDEESAALVLRTMLAEAPAGETIEISWLTSAQQWAIREVVACGIELQPFGPVMVRGMDGPPCPYIPSGGFG
jgi:ribosomal protein S18 acetylase RimI-like enzyme